jgi:CBS domain-containing protein
MKIRDIMVKNVVSLKPTDTVKDAFEKFHENNISGCPVVNDKGEVIGMFTETDLLKSLNKYQREFRMIYPPYIPIGISFVETKKQKKVMSTLQEIGNTEIEKVMRSSIITVSADESIEHALQLMVENSINRLPVVKSNKLVGIITRGDVIKGIYKNTIPS